ncbi:MAG: FtsX-like permease family protein [Bacteroidia bacterium]|nr:FtsX-like permease family protein [Bacteroidia bacterium]
MEANFSDTMHGENLVGKIFLLFTCLSIFVAGMGLYGLANYAAMYRSKEIGIRKVMGARTGQVVFLMSKDFAKLVGLAFLIAAPVSWLALDRWLASFAYRTSVGLPLIALAGASALFIALGTISYQAWKSALANPVDSLRDE